MPGGDDVSAKVALEKHRATFAAACPQAKGSFTFRILIGKDGGESSRSLRHDEKPPDPTAVDCLLTVQGTALKLEPQKSDVGVLVSLQLP